MSKSIVIYVTCAGLEEAEKLGEFMVSNRYAACVNIVPSIKSIYWWDNKLNKEQEALLIFKTKGSLFSLFKENIKKQHSYSVPEIIAVEIAEGDEDYLSWIEKEATASS